MARSLDSLLKLRRAPEFVEGPLSLVNGPLSGCDETIESNAMPLETNEPDVGRNRTNEATVEPENATNEPTVAADVGPDGPTYTDAQRRTRRSNSHLLAKT